MSKATADLVRVLITIYGERWIMHDEGDAPSLQAAVEHWQLFCNVTDRIANGIAYSPDTGEVWIGTLNPQEVYGGPSAALPPWAGFGRWQSGT